MSTFLTIIGIAIYLVCFVAGILSGSFGGFLISITGAITSGTLFIALGIIINNQQDIVHKLDERENNLRYLIKANKKVCLKCGYKYDEDYTSCPYCGFKEDR